MSKKVKHGINWRHTNPKNCLPLTPCTCLLPKEVRFFQCCGWRCLKCDGTRNSTRNGRL